MNINVIGLGYIGLPTAIMFANFGQKVLGVDVDENVVSELTKGIVHIEEPGLQTELDLAISKNNFKVNTRPLSADVHIIAVPTPNNLDEYKSCNLEHVESALESVLSVLKIGDTIIVESTISPKSMENRIKPIVESQGFKIGEDIYLVHCPERVLPGHIIHELIYNNRIIGGITPNCTKSGKKIYETFVKGELIETTASAAEMSKLMENTYRDVNIALANELVKICKKLEINALDVIEMANKHPRVNLHFPGPGVGGHCLAVDPYFVIAEAPNETPLMQVARQINFSMPEYIINQLEELTGKESNSKIAVLGLTYKGDIDDTRESPALEIYKKLLENPLYQTTAYDPHVQMGFVESSFKEAVQDADVVLILSDHSEFNQLNAESFSNTNNAVIFDTKNIAKNCEGMQNYFNLGTISKIQTKVGNLIK